MTVLMISLDTTFLAEKGGARGDVLLRHIRIAEKVSHLHVIVFSTGSARAASLRPTEKLTLYPTQSVNKAMRVPDAFRIGLRVCRRDGGVGAESSLSDSFERPGSRGLRG
jgi:hypothetical protein